MIYTPEKILPQVAWSSIAGNVIKLTDWTYRITVSPINVSEPGVKTADKKIGYYGVDFLGHLYSIIGVSGNNIIVNDDFKTGIPPIVDRPIIIFKSVGDGKSQWLPPIRYEILDRSARSYIEAINLEVLWRNDPNAKKVPFTNTEYPSIENYQTDQTDPEDATKTINYAEIYGEDPSVRCIVVLDANTSYQLQQMPQFVKTAGKLTRVWFDMTGNPSNGYLIISRS